MNVLIKNSLGYWLVFSLAICNAFSNTEANVISIPFNDYSDVYYTTESYTTIDPSIYYDTTVSETEEYTTKSHNETLKSTLASTENEGILRTDVTKDSTEQVFLPTTNAPTTVLQTKPTTRLETSKPRTTPQIKLKPKTTRFFLPTTKPKSVSTTKKKVNLFGNPWFHEEDTDYIDHTGPWFVTTAIDYDTTEEEIIAPALVGIWATVWIWVIIAIMILIFLIILPIIIIILCCCRKQCCPAGVTCCGCCADKKPEKSNEVKDDLSTKELDVENPIYDNVPSDSEKSLQPKDEKEKLSTQSDNETQESTVQGSDEKDTNIDDVKSIVIEIEDPMKSRPWSPSLPGKTSKADVRVNSSPTEPKKRELDSFSRNRSSIYGTYPRSAKRSLSNHLPLPKTETEVKLDIGNETIIKSNPVFPTSAMPHNVSPSHRPEPATIQPRQRPEKIEKPVAKTRQNHQRKPSRRRKSSSKEKVENIPRKRSSHRHKGNRHYRDDKVKKHNKKDIDYSKQKQLLKTANSLESLLDAITKFTKEYPIPESHKEPLKPVRNRERSEKRKPTEKSRSSRPRHDERKRPSKNSPENRRQTDEPRRARAERKDKVEKPRPRVSDKRTLEWAKEQQKIRTKENREEKRRNRPRNPKAVEKPPMKEVHKSAAHTEPDFQTKDSYEEEKRRKQLEKDLKKMKKYCNKVITDDIAKEVPAEA